MGFADPTLRMSDVLFLLDLVSYGGDCFGTRAGDLLDILPQSYCRSLEVRARLPQARLAT